MRADEERVSAARAEVPPAAFTMPLDQLGLKEHVFNILVEAGFENIGDLMMSLKLDENKVLGLAGVGPKAIQNIQEQLAAIQFPEVPAEVKADAAVSEEVPVEQIVEPVAVDAPPLEIEEPAKVEKVEEETEEENAKDGVSLDELFKLKPEIFQSPSGTDEDEAAKKKGKKQKKKGVELVLDEELGEVVGHKKHKRGEDDLGVDE